MDKDEIFERIAAEEVGLANLGWDTPDYLFGLFRDRQELWMEMPGGAEAFLRALADLGVGAQSDVEALAVVMSSEYDPNQVLGLPVLGALRLACEDAGIRPERLPGHLRYSPPVRRSHTPVRAIFCVRRDGATYVIARRQGRDPERLEALPPELGGHANLRTQALRVLGVTA